jgi:hypothetical protein
LRSTPRRRRGRCHSLLDENGLRALPLPAAAVAERAASTGRKQLRALSALNVCLLADGDPIGRPNTSMGSSATAFVGRRHFDDPRLIDRYFTLAPSID